jgi:hypothetical protein
MKATTKLLAAGVAVTAMLAAGAYAFAQQDRGAGPGMGMGHGMMHGMGGGMMGGPMMGPMGGALADPTARLDAIKAEIGIKPEQIAAWEAYAKVVKDTAAEQRSHREHIDADAVRNLTPTERQQHFTAMRTQRDTARAKVRTAAETLLAQLDDAQKAKAQRALPGLAATAPGSGMRHGMMGGRGMGPGMGPGMGSGGAPRLQR